MGLSPEFAHHAHRHGTSVVIHHFGAVAGTGFPWRRAGFRFIRGNEDVQQSVAPIPSMSSMPVTSATARAAGGSASPAESTSAMWCWSAHHAARPWPIRGRETRRTNCRMPSSRCGGDALSAVPSTRRWTWERAPVHPTERECQRRTAHEYIIGRCPEDVAESRHRWPSDRDGSASWLSGYRSCPR